MASVTGYVQWIYTEPMGEYAKFAVGPTPTDTQLLLIMMDSGDTAQEIAMKAALIDSFSAAFAARHEVTAEYSSTDSTVTYFEMFRA